MVHRFIQEDAVQLTCSLFVPGCLLRQVKMYVYEKNKMTWKNQRLYVIIYDNIIRKRYYELGSGIF